jgi:hypothetical protein
MGPLFDRGRFAHKRFDPNTFIDFVGESVLALCDHKIDFANVLYVLHGTTSANDREQECPTQLQSGSQVKEMLLDFSSAWISSSVSTSLAK